MHFAPSLDCRTHYVEKKTCKFEVQAARIDDFAGATGAGLGKTGFIFDSLKSSLSTFRCSCL